MDQHKFVEIISQFPQLWDRSHHHFRDKDAKDGTWDVIGHRMGCSGDSCKESFKAIREKYIREKEKSAQNRDTYREWDLLPKLKFLDPNIVPRKQSISNEDDVQKAEEYCSQLNLNSLCDSINQTDFDKALITLVKNTSPIWDRNSNTYPNKSLKNQLWHNIAAKLGKDVNTCMLRWKALREKYIRQKIKFQQEGDVKWELLDEMKFLDKVIQYRRKQTDNDFHRQRNYNESFNGNFRPAHPLKQNDSSHDTDYSQTQLNYETGDENSINDSSSDFTPAVKEENTVFQVADSSYVADHERCSRKRSISTNGEGAVVEKKSKPEEEAAPQNKTPEQLFGDLVVAMLSKKPEKDRNLYMIEIMTVLSK